MEKDYSETKECRLSLAKETFYKPSNTALVLKKNNALTTIFNKK